MPWSLMGKRLPYILAFAVPFAAYSTTLLGTFYYDDNVVFFGHQVKVLAEAPFSVFSSETHYLPGAPRSIHVFFLLLIYKAFGAAPLPYHVFNLLVHSATTLLVFLFLKRLLSTTQDTGSATKAEPVAPLLGSLIFGLHPVHVENITFVTLGGTDVFYAFWALLSLMFYIWFRDKSLKGNKNYILLAVSALAYAFALMSKESATAFILVYPLTEFVLRRKGFLWAVPHATVLGFMKMDILASAAPSLIRQVAVAETGATGFGELLKSLGFFAKSVFVPYPHMPYIKEFSSTPMLYAFVAVAVLWLAAGILFRKRLITYSALWFAVVSVPYLFVPAVVKNVAITAERYIYAPSIALALLGGWALTAGWNNEKFNAAIKSVVVIVLFVYILLGTVYFYQAWRTEEAFWRYAIRTNSEYVSGYSNLSTILFEKGNVPEAEEVLLEGLRKEKGMPQEFAQAAYALGNLKKSKGDLKEAESHYMQSLRYTENDFAFMDLGFLYLDTGKPEKAKWALEGALKYRRSPRVLAGLALAHLRLGDKQAAETYAREAYERARDERLKTYAEGLLREALK
jgi:tetratricopeptide (TPR) repeat protein